MNKDSFNNHIQITGIGFGSKRKDEKVGKDIKNDLKKGMNR